MSSFQHTVTSHAPFGAAARVGRLERLPGWLRIAPIAAHWLWLSLRHRSLTLPSCANPEIAAGGLVGEGKLEYFALMGRRALAACAATTWLPCGGAESADEAEAAMAACGLRYPVVMKPDVANAGHGVRRVDRRTELAAYLDAFPRGERILIQRFVPDDGEASLFYMHRPDESRGRLVGMLLRHYPRVVGDGRSSVAELIDADPRLCRLMQDHLGEPGCNLRHVPAPGEEQRVAMVASARVGGLCEDATSLITPALTEAIETIARDMGDFHVGRFDVKFESLAALRAGRGFSILDVDGAGSKAEHAWDPALSLREAYRILFDRQRQVFRVGEAMRRRGHRPAGLLHLLKLLLNQRQLTGQYPASN